VANQQRADCEAAAAIAAQLPLNAGLAEAAALHLASMFLPEKAPRPETPKFLENATRDQETRRSKSKSANLAEIERQFASNVKRQN
jgi:hypothetical protein